MFAREVAGESPVLIIRCSLPAPTLVFYLGWRLLWINASVGCNTGQPVEHIAGLIPVGDTLFSGFNISSLWR